MTTLEDIVKGEQPFNLDDTFDELSELTIPKDIWERLCEYARTISDLGLGDLECGGYLMTDADRFDGKVTGILYPEQAVGTYKTAFADLQTVYDEERDTYLRPIGMWHVHPSFSTYPSPTDRTTLNNFFSRVVKTNVYAPNSEEHGGNMPGYNDERSSSGWTASVDHENNTLRIVSGHVSPRIYEISIDGLTHIDDVKGKINVREANPRGPGFFYSLIINKETGESENPHPNQDYHLLLKTGYGEESREDFGHVSIGEPIGINGKNPGYEIREKTLTDDGPIDNEAYAAYCQQSTVTKPPRFVFSDTYQRHTSDTRFSHTGKDAEQEQETAEYPQKDAGIQDDTQENTSSPDPRTMYGKDDSANEGHTRDVKGTKRAQNKRKETKDTTHSPKITTKEQGNTLEDVVSGNTQTTRNQRHAEREEYDTTYRPRRHETQTQHQNAADTHSAPYMPTFTQHPTQEVYWLTGDYSELVDELYGSFHTDAFGAVAARYIDTLELCGPHELRQEELEHLARIIEHIEEQGGETREYLTRCLERMGDTYARSMDERLEAYLHSPVETPGDLIDLAEEAHMTSTYTSLMRMLHPYSAEASQRAEGMQEATASLQEKLRTVSRGENITHITNTLPEEERKSFLDEWWSIREFVCGYEP